MKEGETVDFSCHATGDPVPELHWFYKGQPVVASERYVFSQKEEISHLEVKNVTPEDVGDVQVVAKNTFGEASCAATFEVEGRQENNIVFKISDTFVVVFAV